jgi:hypothetical protein
VAEQALRVYMARHIVADGMAREQLLQLAGRVVRTGRLFVSPGGGLVLAQTHPRDGRYALMLDFDAARIIRYTGMPTSWHERTPRADLDELNRLNAREEAAGLLRQQRRAQAQVVAREAAERAARCRALERPDLPFGRVYDRWGNQASVPMPRPAVADEAAIRRLGRQDRVLFHGNALNARFFSGLSAGERPAALAAVVDVLLRAPTKGVVTVTGEAVTVTHRKVVVRLSPDCLVVTAVLVPPGKKRHPPLFKPGDWKLCRP